MTIRRDVPQGSAEQPSSQADPANLQALLQQGLAHHHANELAQAETLYRQVLDVEPDNVDALYLMSVIAVQVSSCAIGTIWRASSGTWRRESCAANGLPIRS